MDVDGYSGENGKANGSSSGFDSIVVFLMNDILDVMQPIFNAPVAPDSLAVVGCGGFEPVRNVERIGVGLLAFFDSDPVNMDHPAQVCPLLSFGAVLGIKDKSRPTRKSAMPVFFDGKMVQRFLLNGNALDFLKKRFLIAFDLGYVVIFALYDGCKRFFWVCRASTVRVIPIPCIRSTRKRTTSPSACSLLLLRYCSRA